MWYNFWKYLRLEVEDEGIILASFCENLQPSLLILVDFLIFRFIAKDKG